MARRFAGIVGVMGIGAALLFVAATGARAQALNAYLQVPGVKGDSADAAHRGWIEVHSFQWGELQGEAMADRESSAPSVSELSAGAAKAPAPAAKKGAIRGMPVTGAEASRMPTGKRMHKPLTVVKEWGASSPQLMQACATGKHFPALILDVVSGGETHRYRLINAEITAFQTSGGGDRPTESISFTYQKIEMENR